MYKKLSSLQITTLKPLEKWENFSMLIQSRVQLSHWWHHTLTIVMDFSLKYRWVTMQAPEVPNNAARVVSCSKYNHITPILKHLHCLPIRKRIEFKQATTRTLGSNLLQLLHTNLKSFGDRAFCAYVSYLWNEFHDNSKAADSVQNMKTQLKMLLLRKEFTWLLDHRRLSTDYYI